MRLEEALPLDTLDAVSAIVVVAAPDGEIRYVNEAFCEATGYAADGIVGRSVLDFVHADEAADVRSLLDGIDASMFPRRRARRMVGDRVIAWTAVAVLDDSGDIDHVVATGIDVTEQHAAEQELAQSRARLDAFFEHSPSVMFMRDNASRYTFANSRLEEVADRPRAEILGRTPDEIWTAEEAELLLEHDREVTRTGQPRRSRYTLALGGEDHHWLGVKFPLQAPDGSPNGVGGIATDITDLVRQEQRLEASYEEALTRLARAVELRDPGTAGHVERMSAYCELIARRLGFDDERSALVRSASVMHDAGKIGIPDSILLSRRPLTADERLVMETHAKIGHDLLAGSESPLLQLAATIAHTHHERYDGSGYPRGLAGDDIALEGRIAAVADVFDAITSDRPYRSGLSVATAIELMTAERATQFDPEVLDAFLDAMADVVELVDGRADDSAVPDIGPLGLLPLHANDLPPAGPGVRGRRIVVIEPDDETRSELRTLYERHGAHVHDAPTGEDGVRAVYDVRPDLVVMALALPRLSGWQTLTRIRDLSDVAVMVLSDSDAELEKARALNGGADDHVTKPFGPHEMLAMSEALIRRSASAGRNEEAHYADPLVKIDFERAAAYAGGRPLNLTPLELRVLTALVRHRGQVLSASQLLTLAWGDERLPRDRVTVYVRYLRAKFSAVGVEAPIETVRGFGYRYELP